MKSPRRMCRQSPESLAENTQAISQTYTALCTFVSCRTIRSRPTRAFRVVARTLARKGFHGKINNHSLSRTTPVELTATKDYVHPPPAGDDEIAEWLSFNHIPRRGLIYPERLHIEHPLAFELILPGPTTVPLTRMLEEYSRLVPVFRDLVSISYLWCYSLDMKEISPTCLALLFLSFLQV